MKSIREWTECPEVKKDMDKKTLVGLVLSLIVVVLLGVALVGPWYSMKMEGTVMDVEMEVKADATLTEMKAEGMGVTTTKKWSDEDAPENQAKLYTNVYYIAIVTLVIAIISLICLILSGIGKLGIKIAGIKIGAILLLITMIFAIVAPVYFAVAVPGAMHEDSATWDKGFMGSEEEAGMKTTWGPGYGWYLAIVAFVLALIGMIFTFIPGKKTAPAL